LLTVSSADADSVNTLVPNVAALTYTPPAALSAIDGFAERVPTVCAVGGDLQNAPLAAEPIRLRRRCFNILADANAQWP
jgi:hypothetical protein